MRALLSMTLALVASTGCGRLLGIENLRGSADGSVDGPRDEPDGSGPVFDDCTEDVPDGTAANLSVTGRVDEFSTQAIVPFVEEAIVDLCRLSDRKRLATFTTGPDGQFGWLLHHPLPLTVYLKATKSPDYLPTYYHLPKPLISENDAVLIAVKPAQFSDAAAHASIAQDAAKGFVLVRIPNVDPPPPPNQPGANISTVAAGVSICYGNPILPSCAATASSGTGRVWVFNAPPGSITLKGHYDSTTALISQTFDVRAGAITELDMVPF
jgi:hypothetical protein